MKKIAIKITGVLFTLLLGVGLTPNAHAQGGNFAAYTDIYVNSGASFAVFSEYTFSKPSTSIQSMVYTQRSNPGLLIFAENATWSGAAAANCVDGYAKKNGANAFTFPVGDNGRYMPVALSNPSGAQVSYYDADPSVAITSNAFGTTYPALPSGAPFSTSNKDIMVAAVSSTEYWHVDATSTSNVTLTWNSGSNIGSLTSSDLSFLTMVGWNGTEWVMIPSKIDITNLDKTAASPTFSTSSPSLTEGSITTTSAIDLSQYSILSFGKHASFELYSKAVLSGAYRSGSGLMVDSLRVQGNIPLTEPYSAYSAYTHVGDGGGEVIPSASASTILGVTGANAIVDWVFVEFRSKSDSTQVVATASGLIQRDGDIVSPTDGTSPLSIKGLGDTAFFVAVRHRNHLGVMTAGAEALTSSSNVVDFTDGNTGLSGVWDFGTNHPTAGSSFDYDGLAQRDLGSSLRGMWAGDGSQDGLVKYTSPADDVNPLLMDVILHTGNTSYLFNYDLAIGYFLSDYDMNGKAKYTAPGDDINTLQMNVLLHPLNTGFLFNHGLNYEQLP